jgi:hypothetical protein
MNNTVYIQYLRVCVFWPMFVMYTFCHTHSMHKSPENIFVTKLNLFTFVH